MAEEEKVKLGTRVRSLAKNKAVTPFQEFISKQTKRTSSGIIIDDEEMDTALGIDSLELNGILSEAERILMLMDEGMYTLARLTKQQKDKLNIYFYIFNPIYRRIVNIFTRLPLSYITLQKPKLDNNTIVQDYVYAFFLKMLEDCDWSKTIRQAYLYYYLFNSSIILNEDNFDEEFDTSLDGVNYRNLKPMRIEDMETIKKSKNPEETAKNLKTAIEEIINLYDTDKDSITDMQRQTVINATIPNYNPNYTGLVRMRCLNPFDIVSISRNPEINYFEVELPKSEYIQKYIQKNSNTPDEEIRKNLLDMGYSSSYVDLNLENSAASTIEINSLPMSSIYVAEFAALDVCGIESSPLDAILSDSIDYMKARQKQKDRLQNMNRKGVLITPTEDHVYDMDQMEALQDNIIDSANEGMGFVVTANFSCSVEEIDLTTQDIIDVDNNLDMAQNNMAIGSGLPQGMISADDSYGSNYLKMEVLNEEFFAQRADFSNFVEKNIFIPVAIKKGYIIEDDFGNAIPIIPKLNYKVGTIVNSTEFRDLLKELADSEQIPYKMFLEYLGIDAEDAYQDLVKERVRKEETEVALANETFSEDGGGDGGFGGGGGGLGGDIGGGDTLDSDFDMNIGDDLETGGDSAPEPEAENGTETII